MKRDRIERDRLEHCLAGFEGVRLLVVGDVVLDEYLWGEVDRVSPEAPVPVVHVRRESVVLGGAGNVARNVVALGGDCSFCSVVGDDADGRQVVDLVKDLGIDSDHVLRVAGRPTTRKTRVVARSQQIVRFDRETVDSPASSVRRRVLEAVSSAAAHVHGAVFEDYGKGLLSRTLIRDAMRALLSSGVPVAVDPKGELNAYRGAELVKPNLREAERLTGLSARDSADLDRIARKLRTRLGGGDLVVTRGGMGLTLYEGDADAKGIDVRTSTQEVFDVQGAGDTIIATLALAKRSGASLLEAAVLANAAAGIVVGKSGTATATRSEVLAQLPAAIAAAEETE